ncbi:hypothetical protein [Atopococcus tabaci]|uniref:hypothetical protein n=1 Tax=Atopococcus tabaci TaxID=269774 RepID=UPI0004807FF6|nr:hypothetical protein [Atopococcus tabaci]
MSGDRFGLARKYFRLEESIKESQQRLRIMRKKFYSQSMHTRTEEFGAGVLVTVGFRQEKEVVLFVDCLANIQRGIEVKEKKLRYFNDYLQSLTPGQREYLFKRYRRGLKMPAREDVETALNEEINEIEDAIQFMYGFNPEPREYDATGNAKANFQEMLMVLGVK